MFCPPCLLRFAVHRTACFAHCRYSVRGCPFASSLDFTRFVGLCVLAFRMVHGAACFVILTSKQKMRELLRPPRRAGNSRQKLPDSTATFCVCAGAGIQVFQGFKAFFDPFPCLKQALKEYYFKNRIASTFLRYRKNFSKNF